MSLESRLDIVIIRYMYSIYYLNGIDILSFLIEQFRSILFLEVDDIRFVVDFDDDMVVVVDVEERGVVGGGLKDVFVVCGQFGVFWRIIDGLFGSVVISFGGELEFVINRLLVVSFVGGLELVDNI